MPSQTHSKHSLCLQNLRCARGERDLFRDLSVTITSGECLHLTGPNGSGKTSLLRILCGLNSPDSGKITWNDVSINDHYFEKSRYLGHKDALKNELTAFENLHFYQRMDSSMSGRNSADLIDDSLNKMQILHCADLLANQLSFGQRRRLAFARLLLNPVELWILDEPFTGIDKAGRALIESLCLEHLENQGMIILTHHLSLSKSAFAARIINLALSGASKIASSDNADGVA